MIHFRNSNKVSVAGKKSNRESWLRGGRGRQEPDHKGLLKALTKILFLIIRAKGRSH